VFRASNADCVFLSAVRFTVSLHENHEVPLSQAYGAAVAQFRALRAEHSVATSAAAMEAESYGAVFGPSETQRGFMQEEEHLKSFESRQSIDMGIAIARKRWKMEHVPEGGPGEWTRVKEYQRLWQEGVRPSYTPSLTTPIDVSVDQTPAAEDMTADNEFMHVRPDPILQPF
jgi:small subunit ribosomal protein S23